ncbi:MAG: single-stranded-DNA-specific exonuclease RecJ [Defluviitaleaceae bacterium]|nr:single-stranded-DNA-specific exonuclease RecJ [Defluviitaleaceae bacterium]
MKRWILREHDADIALMTKVLKITPALAHVLAGRGIRSKNTAIKYLDPQLAYLHPMEGMAGVSEAVDIIKKAVSDGKKICIYGDYDVDGVSGTVILHKALTKLGANVDYYIPHREREGYGLNIPAVEELAKDFQVLIAIDNGIAGVSEVERAVELGLTVIIIDHHNPQFDENGAELLPPAHAIINPKQSGCPYPFKEMSAAGLAYKFAGHLGVATDEMLIFTTMATFCDVVDLVDENRILAKNGLHTLNVHGTENVGLHTLVKARNLEYNEIDDFAMGFIIGPCINASGRLDSAGIAVELFLTHDVGRAKELAQQLVDLNDKRKEMTTRYVDEIIGGLPDELDDVLVIYSEEIHESIAGIVAGRVKEHAHHPAIVFTKAGEVAKGSARSIEAYNVFEAMSANSDLFLRFGGHPMAAGATMEISNVDILRKRLNDASGLTAEDFQPILYGDMALTLEEAIFALAQDLQVLCPFGKANKEPTFFSYNVTTERAEVIGQSGQTLRLTFRCEEGRKIKAVAFKSVDKFAQHLSDNYSKEVAEAFTTGRLKNMTIKMDIAYNLRINTWQGNSSLQLHILDFKHPAPR